MQSISEHDNNMLIECIFEREIKDVIWNYESSKSPGPNICTLKIFERLLKMR